MRADRDLQEDVIDGLDWEPSVNAAHVGVTVREAIVTLSGHVDTFGEKLVAGETAESIDGVRAVANDVEVRAPGVHARDDEAIARKAADALAWNTRVPQDRIKVLVEDGKVTLDGEVDWYYEKRAAEEAVQYLSGVKEIYNHIDVRPPGQAEDVRSGIERALGRAVSIDANRIEVHVRDGTVILKGRVRSWFERREAEETARAAPGVIEVENELEVGP